MCIYTHTHTHVTLCHFFAGCNAPPDNGWELSVSVSGCITWRVRNRAGVNGQKVAAVPFRPDNIDLLLFFFCSYVPFNRFDRGSIDGHWLLEVDKPPDSVVANGACDESEIGLSIIVWPFPIKYISRRRAQVALRTGFLMRQQPWRSYTLYYFIRPHFTSGNSRTVVLCLKRIN